MYFEPVQPWSASRKLAFRFFFLLLTIFVTPFVFVQNIPGLTYVIEYYYKGFDVLAGILNEWFFHIKPAVQMPNGNGDFPEQWMQLWTSVLLTVPGTVIWTLADRKRADYNQLNYWFCLALRYYVILNGIAYGIFKLTCTQMPFPSLSQMATPLGDYLPMRFSWMFIGYSTSYQFFSGLIEMVAALLLIFRRTATLGILVSLGVFINVMMLNLSYDIPVKINSITLVVICLVLLAMELPRLIAFFFHNRAQSSTILVFPFSTKRGRRIARVVKWVTIVYTGGIAGFMTYQQMDTLQKKPSQRFIPTGVYDVLVHTRAGDTVTIADADSVYWQNLVLDKGADGSIKTADRRFVQRYGRSYFYYKVDSAASLLTLYRTAADSVALVRFRYELQDSVHLRLSSVPVTDSIQLLLRRHTKPFPLQGRPFHWISETNR